MKHRYYFSLLLILSSFSHAQELDLIQYSDISSIPQIALNQKTQTELQALLKHDYPKFQANFEHYSAPYLLKTDEALYYEGRSGSSLQKVLCRLPHRDYVECIVYQYSGQNRFEPDVC